MPAGEREDRDGYARREDIIAAVGAEAPIGVHRAADRLAARTGLAVEKPNVQALAGAGVLEVACWYKQWPLWDCRALDAVDVDALGAVVAEGQAWTAASVHRWGAPASLGSRRDEFTRVATGHGLRLGPPAQGGPAVRRSGHLQPNDASTFLRAHVTPGPDLLSNYSDK